MAKIFIDDWRKPESKHNTPDWILCTSYRDFEQVLTLLIEKKETITEISFDYILEDHDYDGSHCFKLLDNKIEEYKLKLPEKIYIHSEYPNAENNFKSVSMLLSYIYNVDVDLIKIHENGKQTIIKPFDND